MSQIMICGESLIDIVCDSSGTTKEYVGGSPLNVAVALGRLGHPVTMLTQFANDQHGKQIAKHLKASNVCLTTGSDRAQKTSTAAAKIDATGAAKYEFDFTWNPEVKNFNFVPAAIHTGSISAMTSPGAEKIKDLVASLRAKTLISYDPNVRSALISNKSMARKIIESNVILADIVKASDEDVLWLYPGKNISEIAHFWLDLGAKLVIVTRGDAGSSAWAKTGAQANIKGIKVKVVDTVGAGDTFSAGILDYLQTKSLLGAAARDQIANFDTVDLQNLLQNATRLAAITVSRAGANPPWASELKTV